MKKLITALLTTILLVVGSAYAADNDKEFLRLSRLNSKQGAKNMCVDNWANNEDKNKRANSSRSKSQMPAKVIIIYK
jgi:uncharacterized lipoprotein NlpE involved in copper resistance